MTLLRSTDEVENSVHLAEVRGFTELHVEVVPKDDGCHLRKATGSLCRDALLIQRWIGAACGQLIG